MARLQGSTQGVFLSPRVIDQGAFDECAATLRDLIESAEARTAELQTTIEAASTAQRQMHDAQSKQRSRLDLITRMLKALSAKSEQVNGTLDRIEQKATSPNAPNAPTPQRESAPLEPLLERGEAMRTEIELSIRRLAMLRDDARTAARELAATLGHVLEAIEDMPHHHAQAAGDAPKGHLANETAAARASLEAVTDRFRTEIAQDLSKMAAAMQLIAERAETHARTDVDTGEPAEVTIRVRESEPVRPPSVSPLSPGMPIS